MFLETERLALRKFREEDFADFCAYAMDAEMCRMMGRELRGYFAFNTASEAIRKKPGFTRLATMTLDFRGEKTVTVENALWKK